MSADVVAGGLVALGAAVGGPLRYLCARRLDGDVPAGTLVVNVAGSGLVGLFAALGLADHTWALLGVGFCGAFTTYSAFAVQVGDGLLSGERARAAAYAVATVVLAVGACIGGFALGVAA